MIQQFHIEVFQVQIESKDLNSYLYASVYHSTIQQPKGGNNPSVYQINVEKKKLCRHIMEYYPLLKRNEVLIYTTTWLNFENFMLNEISQTQDKYCMISLL